MSDYLSPSPLCSEDGDLDFDYLELDRPQTGDGKPEPTQKPEIKPIGKGEVVVGRSTVARTSTVSPPVRSEELGERNASDDDEDIFGLSHWCLDLAARGRESHSPAFPLQGAPESASPWFQAPAISTRTNTVVPPHPQSQLYAQGGQPLPRPCGCTGPATVRGVQGATPIIQQQHQGQCRYQNQQEITTRNPGFSGCVGAAGQCPPIFSAQHQQPPPTMMMGSSAGAGGGENPLNMPSVLVRPRRAWQFCVIVMELAN